MDSHRYDLSRRLGWLPHPIDGFQRWRNKFAMVFEYDIRKEHAGCKSAELISRYNGEYLFVVTQTHLDAICDDCGCAPFDVDYDIDGELLMPDCSGY